ncbi:MAG: GCN5-related N-acetyltransferase [Nocardioides sp.]|nr:GCN5-related N-acetyltransferase [Nocardioides sp.]
MTDLLGVCTAWGRDSCVVQPETGDPVEIALADIVSGKPVPPRASVRHRVAPAEAQRRALALWPDLHTEPLGDWLLRRSPTATARRANSVLAFEPSGVPDDYERVVAFYDRPVAAVLPDSAEDRLFRGHGWVLESHDADTLFQLAGVSRVRRALTAGPTVAEAVVRVEDGLAVATVDDAASGIAAYDRDWVGFRSIEVAPEHRRRGLGLAVMAALLEWGAEQGATTAYLQVLADNTPALGLYDRLGFSTHHAYRYLTPRAAAAQR